MINKKNRIRGSLVDRIFITFNWVLLIAFALIIAYPLAYIISASFTAGASVMSLSLIPPRVTLAGYKAVFEYRFIWSGYYWSLVYTVVGTLVSLAVTVMCAYPLSRSDFKGRNVIMILCMITMYFSGGLIPTYLNIKNLGLLNSMWSLILPGALSVYNMIVMRTYFQTQIPSALLESAQIDGCGNIQ